MTTTMVVLPTYNEIENLPLMVDVLLNLPVEDLKILVVDDNSPDGTGELADELAARHKGQVFVLHRQVKAGLGQAYVAGFKRAIAMQADYIIQMDADFSHQPEYIPAMIEAAKTHDLVLGSRYAPGGSVDESWSHFRKLLSGFANRLYLPLVLNVPFHDATGGYRLWRRHTLIMDDLDRVRSNGYIFQVEMLYITHRLGFRIAEIPIHFPDRKRGQSKMDFRVQAEAALRALQVRYRHRVLKPVMIPSHQNTPMH
ncbi:MAG: polyprenol monophosphomannose synthase [Anaerolineaceae bacterium]|nr:polyprenol monophosphomannose synthase [Anaerolineaceae bacterium]